MKKYIEGAGVFLLLSLILMLSVNFVFSPKLITALFGAPHLTYIQALVVYGISNIVFKTPTMAVKK